MENVQPPSFLQITARCEPQMETAVFSLSLTKEKCTNLVRRSTVPYRGVLSGFGFTMSPTGGKIAQVRTNYLSLTFDFVATLRA